jgi:hypothetical protein
MRQVLLNPFRLVQRELEEHTQQYNNHLCKHRVLHSDNSNYINHCVYLTRVARLTHCSLIIVPYEVWETNHMAVRRNRVRRYGQLGPKGTLLARERHAIEIKLWLKA